MRIWPNRKRTPRRPGPTEVGEAQELAHQLVAPGFLTLQDAQQAVADTLEDDTTLTSDQLASIVARVWKDRQEEQASWADEGDYDRLSAAFDDLAAAGFVTRMDFTCCQTCGHSEIVEERRADEHAYVFFHQQDTARLVGPDAGLYLAFGLFAGAHPDVDPTLLESARAGNEDARAQLGPLLEELETGIGNQVVTAIRSQGLTVTWGGTRESRPSVSISDWRKKLPT
jgi:hypothetical protein